VAASRVKSILSLPGHGQFAETIRAAALPYDWCRQIYSGVSAENRWLWNDTCGWYGYAKSRRAAEDMAALAFAKLPATRRAELLAPAAPKKPRKPAARNTRGRRR
jgi:hypothetical protein